jgi:hypothetical protein
VVVVELTPSGAGWSMNIIYSFACGADGGEPRAAVVFASAGNLYGTTAEGGSVTTSFSPTKKHGVRNGAGKAVRTLDLGPEVFLLIFIRSAKLRSRGCKSMGNNILDSGR